ncbi:MAG: hypothetical protein ACI35O_03990 [Bacillaceae bacterium]
MKSDKNKVIDFGGNGLQFEQDAMNRPRLQDLDGGEFVISNVGSGHIYFKKEDVDDLIILLKEVKAHDYKIDY